MKAITDMIKYARVFVHIANVKFLPETTDNDDPTDNEYLMPL